MVLDIDSYWEPIALRLKGGSRASATEYTDKVVKHEIKELIFINRSLNDTQMKGGSCPSLGSLICQAIFPNARMAIFAGFVEDHQLIGGVSMMC